MRRFQHTFWSHLAGICIWLLSMSMLTVSQSASAEQAVYQYAVTEAHRTTYLWIPPECASVRGIIVAFANLTERQWLEDPAVRKVAERRCLGIVWIGPGDESILNADMKPGAGEALQATFRALALVSGFPELEFAPVIPTGHSAHGQFAWRFAQWAPERTIATLPIKTVPIPGNLDLPGIPMLYLVGETTEWPQYRDGRIGDRDFFWPHVRDSALRLRQADPDNLIGVATDPGGGHFDWSPADGRLIALFIEKACAARLPKYSSEPGPVHLRPLKATDGWLADTGGVQPDRWPPAPYAHYQGSATQAYWFFDREMAEAVTRFNGDRVARKHQMLTFEQDGALLPVATQGFAGLKFEPESDGITFKLKPAFLPAIPPELVAAGTPLGHAEGPIHLNVITGPAEQLASDTFRVAMGRGDERDIWIEEENDGDREFRKAVQPGKLSIPARLTEGTPQQIHFDAIPDLRTAAAPIPLHASSTSGLPVRFFVNYGPGSVKGDRLVLNEIPKYARCPIEVEVVAYQWGRLADKFGPAIQTAEPVSRKFRIEINPHGNCDAGDTSPTGTAHTNRIAK
jgi:hypothetical protein